MIFNFWFIGLLFSECRTSGLYFCSLFLSFYCSLFDFFISNFNHINIYISVYHALRIFTNILFVHIYFFFISHYFKYDEFCFFVYCD